jgi:hypothetical protein
VGESSGYEVHSQTQQKSPKSCFQDAIIGLADNFGSSNYQFTIKEYIYVQNISVLNEDNSMSQLEVHLLGNYYKNQNFKSWNLLFVSDSLFIDVIENSSYISR